MNYLNKFILYALISLGSFNYQINAAGIIKSIFYSKEKRWFDAARSGKLDVIQNLLGKIDVNLQDKDGNTALMWASREGHENIVKLLLQVTGIDINVQNLFYETALSLAYDNAKKNILKILLKVAGIKFKSQDNESYLIRASFFGDEDMVKLLLQIPAININAQNESGETALLCAACPFMSTSRRGHYENMVKLLLQVPNININVQDKNLNTPLIIASKAGHENIVKLLLQIPGIDVNAQCEKGNTALMWAVSNSYENIVKLLLQSSDINFNVQNKTGSNVYDLAKEHGYSAIAEFLALPIFFEDYDLDLAKERGYSAIEKLIDVKVKELIDQALEAIRLNNLEQLKIILCQLMLQPADKIVDENGNILLKKTFAIEGAEIIFWLLLLGRALATKSYEIFFWLLQNVDDPQRLLECIFFEAINPTSDLFKFFVALGYGQLEPITLVDITPKKIASEEPNPNVCGKCQKPNCIKQCSHCKKVYYCSTRCQKADWHEHKLICTH